MSTAQRPRLSEAEYLAFEREASVRHEFLDGEIVAMAGASLRHNRIVGNLYTLLRARLDGAGCEVFTGDLKLRVEASGLFTYPDLTVLCGEPRLYAETDDTVVNPTLLVEVLSPSTEAYDRGDKFAHYRTIESLQAVIFVAQKRPRAELFTRRGDLWTLETAEGLDASLDLGPLEGVSLELDAVYQRVEF